MRRHSDTAYSLHRALLGKGAKISLSTLAMWRRGGKEPQSVASLKVSELVEDRYRLPEGYFYSKRQREPKAPRRPPIPGIGRREMRRMAWHLPDDFGDRTARRAGRNSRLGSRRHHQRHDGLQAVPGCGASPSVAVPDVDKPFQLQRRR